ASPVKPSPPAKPAPDHPLLTLLGTIAGDAVEIGVFTDEISHDVVRLKAGEAHDDWTLSSVCGRTAIFQKQGYPAAVLALPAPATQANAPSAAIAGDSRQFAGVAAANTFVPPVIPPSTHGGSRRPPREGS